MNIRNILIIAGLAVCFAMLFLAEAEAKSTFGDNVNISNNLSAINAIFDELFIKSENVNTTFVRVDTYNGDFPNSSISGQAGIDAGQNASISSLEADVLKYSNHSNLSNLAWTTANHTIDTDVNFSNFKAIALSCDNGAVLPTSPTVGQWFLHTPAGRKVLMQYDGTKWHPLVSLGTITMYVDINIGTDDQNEGYSEEHPFAEINFALDQIPIANTNNVVIYLAPGYYTSFTTGGKVMSGSYTVKLEAINTTDYYNSTMTSGTQGTQTVQATVTKTGASWLPGEWAQGYWIEILSGNNTGEIRIIETNTADTLTLIGKKFTYSFGAGDQFRIFHNNVFITDDNTINPTTVIYHLKNIDIEGLNVWQAYVTLEQVEHLITSLNTNSIRNSIYVVEKSFGRVSQEWAGEYAQTSTYEVSESYYFAYGCSTCWSALIQNAYALVHSGTVLEGFLYGMYGNANGMIQLWWGQTQTNVFVKNNTYGVGLEAGSRAFSNYATFTGNTYDATQNQTTMGTQFVTYAVPCTGVDTLSSGTVTVSTACAKTDSLIIVTPQSGTTAAAVWVSARVDKTSFTIKSSSSVDARPVAWVIYNVN